MDAVLGISDFGSRKSKVGFRMKLGEFERLVLWGEGILNHACLQQAGITLIILI